MRLTFGKLTRRLPRATPAEGDVLISKTWYCGTQPDEFYVLDAVRDDAEGFRRRLSRGHARRKDALAVVWDLLAARPGGRLLDYQRGVLAEQPYLWRVQLKRHLIPVEDRHLFERRKRGECQIIDTLMVWAGLPKADARTLARLIIARGDAVYPLTQTEIRQAQQPMGQREGKGSGVTRRVLSAWTLIEAWPAEVLPTPLRAPAT